MRFFKVFFWFFWLSQMISLKKSCNRVLKEKETQNEFYYKFIHRTFLFIWMKLPQHKGWKFCNSKCFCFCVFGAKKPHSGLRLTLSKIFWELKLDMFLIFCLKLQQRKDLKFPGVFSFGFSGGNRLAWFVISLFFFVCLFFCGTKYFSNTCSSVNFLL